MSGGTFMVARGIWDHEEFMPSPFSEREAFLWLISEASWKPRRKRVGKVVVDLERGQLAHSTRFLAEAWDWSHSKVRRFLDRLENRHMIRRASDTGVSVICVVNYDTYQASAQSSGTAAAQKAAQQRHTSGTNEKKDEIKGIRKDTDTYVSVTRAKPTSQKSCISDDAQITDAMMQGAHDRGHSQLEADAQFQRFKNDALAKGKTFADWDIAFVTWLDSPYFKPITTKGQTHGKLDGEAAEFARRAGERWAARFMDSGQDQDASDALLPAGDPIRIGGSSD